MRFSLASLVAILLATTLQAAPRPDVQVVTLQPGENVVTAAAVDDRMKLAYFATAPDKFKYSLEQASATIAVIRLTPFMRKGTLRLKPGENAIYTISIDTRTSEGYFGIYGDPNRDVPSTVAKMRLGNSVYLGAVSLGKGEYGVSSSVLDLRTGNGFFGTLYGTVVGVRLADLSVSSSLGVQKENNAFQCAVLSPDGLMGYFGTATGNILKVTLADMTPAGNLSLLRRGEGFRAAFVPPKSLNRAYFVTGGKPTEVYEIDLPSFNVARSFPLLEGENEAIAAFPSSSGNAAWVVLRTKPCKIVKIDLVDMRRLSAITLSPSYGTPSVATYQRKTGAAIIGFDGTPARLVRVHLK
jgi:hypothetical protein